MDYSKGPWDFKIKGQGARARCSSATPSLLEKIRRGEEFISG
jgi:hypothetical protein